MLGDQGSKFSGGEKQRLSIIRSLLKDSGILLFDEPTNALDSINEVIFSNYIKKMKAQGKTTIIISHKLSIANWSDQVLFLGKNNNIEIGTHEELKNRPMGSYNNLYTKYLQTISEGFNNTQNENSDDVF